MRAMVLVVCIAAAALFLTNGQNHHPVWLILLPSLILIYALAFRVLVAAREGIGYQLNRLVTAGIVGLIAAAVAPSILQQVKQEGQFGIGVVAGIIAFGSQPKRSRRISESVRRRVIQRDRTSRGLKYDPRKDHIDHTWPFARWGGNTADNLRVISKSDNLRKGKRKPKLRDWL